MATKSFLRQKRQTLHVLSFSANNLYQIGAVGLEVLVKHFVKVAQCKFSFVKHYFDSYTVYKDILSFCNVFVKRLVQPSLKHLFI